MRNPWGKEVEWTGAWSDGSEEWAEISEEEKESLGINFDIDGEWWMSYDDFVDKFDQLEMCNLPLEGRVDCEKEEDSWSVKEWSGEWVEGETAGGCRYLSFSVKSKYQETFQE